MRVSIKSTSSLKRAAITEPISGEGAVPQFWRLFTLIFKNIFVMESPKSPLKTISHKIPHRLNAGRTYLLPGTQCGVCKKLMWNPFSQSWKCFECPFVCHEKCSSLAPLNCGLTDELLQSAMECCSLHNDSVHDLGRLGHTCGKENCDNNQLLRSFSAPVLKHEFKKRKFTEPRPCNLCDQPIWGRNGMMCAHCESSYHKHCLEEIGEPNVGACSNGQCDEDMESAIKLVHELSESHINTLNRRRDSPFPSDTYLRVSRRKFADAIPSAADVFQLSLPTVDEDKKDAVALATPFAPGKRNGQYRKRIHQFRGHDYVANYLPEIVKCHLCLKNLGDGGTQCYQCLHCDSVCHKMCYTRSKPCHVKFGTLEGDEQNSLSLSQSDYMLFRNTLRRSRNSSVDMHDFVENFSDELQRFDATIHREKDLLYDYIFEEKMLGSGQYGIVKAGHFRHDPSQKFAVKLIDKKRFWINKLPHEIDRIPKILQRELDILKKLDHPGIVKMYNFIDMPTQTMVIMEMATEGDLLDFIMKNHKLTEDLTNDLAVQILKALKYLHDHGIVHRDLKPENLLLSSRNGRKIVQLADFGFATVLEKVGSEAVNSNENPYFMKSIVGTPAYMAPEILESRVWSLVRASKHKNGGPIPIDKKGYTSAADMWSLGVVLYVCLGGVFPFDSQKSIVDQIIKCDFFFPDEYFAAVSDTAVDFLCQLLIMDPRRRLTCNQALQHPWLNSH